MRSSQPARMISFFRGELALTSRVGRFGLYCWAGFFMILWIAATIYQLSIPSYADAAAELPMVGYVFVWKAVIPFLIAVGVRRRGGDFAKWYFCSVFFGIILMAILYACIWDKKPRLDVVAVQA